MSRHRRPAAGGRRSTAPPGDTAGMRWRTAAGRVWPPLRDGAEDARRRAGTRRGVDDAAGHLQAGAIRTAFLWWRRRRQGARRADLRCRWQTLRVFHRRELAAGHSAPPNIAGHAPFFTPLTNADAQRPRRCRTCSPARTNNAARHLERTAARHVGLLLSPVQSPRLPWRAHEPEAPRDQEATTLDSPPPRPPPRRVGSSTSRSNGRRRSASGARSGPHRARGAPSRARSRAWRPIRRSTSAEKRPGGTFGKELAPPRSFRRRRCSSIWQRPRSGGSKTGTTRRRARHAAPRRRRCSQAVAPRGAGGRRLISAARRARASRQGAPRALRCRDRPRCRRRSVARAAGAAMRSAATVATCRREDAEGRAEDWRRIAVGARRRLNAADCDDQRVCSGGSRRQRSDRGRRARGEWPMTTGGERRESTINTERSVQKCVR